MWCGRGPARGKIGRTRIEAAAGEVGDRGRGCRFVSRGGPGQGKIYANPVLTKRWGRVGLKPRPNLGFSLDLIKIQRSGFMDFVKDLWGFLKVRKKFWLLPIILTLLFFGALMVFASGSAIAPFIYTIF